MSLRKFFEEHLRGWLPKEPKTGMIKLRGIRKSAAIMLTATLIITSVSFFVSYSFFNRPPVFPEPVAPVAPVPNDNGSGDDNASSPSQTGTWPSEWEWPSSSNTSFTSSGQGNWTLTVEESKAFAVLAYDTGYHGMQPSYFYPSEQDNIFLAVKFILTPVLSPNSLDVKDILFVVDDVIQYSPSGYSSYFLIPETGQDINYPRYMVGNFTGTITATGVQINVRTGDPNNPGSSIFAPTIPSSFIFVYELPRECFTGTRNPQLRIKGFQGSQTITVPLPLPPPVFFSSAMT